MKIKPIEKNLIIPFILVTLSSLLMIITLFLPFSTATDDLKAEINKNPDYVFYEDVDLEARDMVNRSMVDYAKVYSTLSNRLFAGNEGNIYIIIVAAIGIFALIGLICAIFKKAIPTIVFTILSFLVFAFLSFDVSALNAFKTSCLRKGSAMHISVFVHSSAVTEFLAS